ncbi:MAG: 4-alpha-glucanotransferase [Oscillospiraceae bacterium]|nr:4-alpha-glucanotransferase [Oscillospiraceae bacterium]
MRDIRSAGVLLPVTMLHGPFGIGTLGKEAMEFVGFLKKSGFSAWQILPVEHTGECFSPYKCISAFAGEPMLIDPRGLFEMGLITDDDLLARMDGMVDYYVNYELVYEKQWKLLRKAYERLEDQPYLEFRPFWLDDYAQYMADKFCEDADFYKFVQWLFDLQWRGLKSYANKLGISMIGDMPIYVSEDSVEVWSNPELFDMDAVGAGKPASFSAVGGAPPDYFNPLGQRWGNPVYNWELMKKDGYKWWTDRMRAALERYDVVRLDHFRGFESYWRIPFESADARLGKWVKGPGIEIFNAFEKNLGENLPIIAEDLGDITEDVEKLLQQTGFRGMRVLQFGFHGDGRHLPHNFDENIIAYTGTHDNTTLLAWMLELEAHDREKALFYLGFNDDWTVGGPNSAINRAWIRALYMSRASLVIVPIQDLLGYGGDTRTNTPGTIVNNWRFRILDGSLSQIDSGFYAELSKMFGRDNAL